MRLNVNIPRVVRPEFGQLLVITRQGDDTCIGSPNGETLEHIGQGEAVAACGACSSLMVLGKYIAPENSIDEMLGATHVYDPDWTPPALENDWPAGSSPLGIAQTMQTQIPPELEPGFNVVALNDSEKLSRAICWSIAVMNVAPIVLVHGRAHWVVVDKCKVSKTPESSLDLDYTICYLYIQDPALRCDPDPLQDFASKPYYEALTEEEWKRLYVDLSVPSRNIMPTERYASKFVAVTVGNEEMESGELPVQNGVEGGDETEPMGCDIEAIVSIIEYEALFNDDPWSGYRNDAVEPLYPLSVLDHQNPDQYSCLTAFVPRGSPPQDRNIVLIIRSGYGTSFRGAVATTLDGKLDVGDGTLFSIAPEEVVGYLVDNEIEWVIGENTYRALPIDPDFVPPLIWAPYVESMSPYLPFYVISAQEFAADGTPGPIVTVYLRLDGQVFLSVTPIWPPAEVEDQQGGNG